MQYAYKIFKNHIAIGSLFAMVLLASLGAQILPMRSPPTAYQETTLTTSNQVALTTTTNTTVAEVLITVPETTTTEVTVLKTTSTTFPVIKTTTTEPYVVTTIPSVIFSGSDGPPHNTTSLVGCISYYESTWGKDPNVFQFTQGTWETYGGVGLPSNASYSRQETIFWIAWEDDGPNHWAAQKGRCF